MLWSCHTRTALHLTFTLLSDSFVEGAVKLKHSHRSWLAMMISSGSGSRTISKEKQRKRMKKSILSLMIRCLEVVRHWNRSLTISMCSPRQTNVLMKLRTRSASTASRRSRKVFGPWFPLAHPKCCSGRRPRCSRARAATTITLTCAHQDRRKASESALGHAFERQLGRELGSHLHFAKQKIV